MIQFIHTDNYQWLLTQPDNSFDSIVTDAPYGLGKEPDAVKVLQDWIDHGYHEVKGGGFMGKKWDSFVPQPRFWKECLRVLKPGGYCLSFFGTRTYDWGVMAIRLAGFEIRDQIAWVYGSGFPKSMDVSKAIDKAMGVEREDKWEGLDRKIGPTGNKKCDKCGKWLSSGNPCLCPRPQDEPQSDLAKHWSGWGTALKPAVEPIVVARKPLIGTVVQNIEAHGTGAININDCRVDFVSEGDRESATFGTQTDIKNEGYGSKRPSDGHVFAKNVEANPIGRWPANLIHDGSDEVIECFPDAKGQQGDLKVTGKPRPSSERFGDIAPPLEHKARVESETSAARFFYMAKASRGERNLGLEEQNNHPTVKPIALMRYLVRLVTPKGGRVLDPFCGSGTTGIACKMEHFDFVGLDETEDYIKISEARIVAWEPEPPPPPPQLDLFG